MMDRYIRSACLGIFLFPMLLQAQYEPSGQFRLLGIGAIQRPITLEIEGIRSRHMARHLFFGVTYQKPIAKRYRIGLGAGLSWGRYGIRVDGAVPDPSGAYHVSDERWSSFVWYPFVRGISGPFAWRTDPALFWVEGIRIFRRNDRKSWWEASAMLAAATPLGIVLDISSHVPDAHGGVDPISARTVLGDQWHGVVGAAGERVIQLKNSDRISIGVDWRMSMAPNYLTELRLWPTRTNQQTVSRSPRFMWLGIRTGYTFTWGDSRKPRWMRMREERGLN